MNTFSVLWIHYWSISFVANSNFASSTYYEFTILFANSLSVARNHYGSIIFRLFDKSGSVSTKGKDDYFKLFSQCGKIRMRLEFVSNFTVCWNGLGFMNSLSFSSIDYVASLYRKITLNSLLVSRNHYSSNRYAHYFFSNSLWIYYLFREFTIDPVSFSRINLKLTIYPLSLREFNLNP